MIQDQIRFGLMPILDAVRELPRTVLPLRSVRYHFVVRGGLAEVEMTQVYRQENAQPLDCEYLFPLPADGAVYRCEATINGRVIRARVEEREAARKIIAEKKAEGRRTALVESERDNLFTLSLGNIQPQDVVEVWLAYLQPLRRLAGQVTLDLPLCPGVRYIPGNPLLRSNRGSGVVDDTDQVPDASRITPPRIDGEHPDAAFIELDGKVEDSFLDGEVKSPSHILATTRQGDMIHLSLAQGGEIPDRDVALRWTERDAGQTALRGWTSRHEGKDYAMLELRAPTHVEVSDAVAQDVYFLVDRSGSMRGEKWQKAIQALHGCVQVLGPKDRVAVTLFESTFNDFDAEPVPPSSLLADRRFRELAAVGTAGGTEMEPALRHVLGQVQRFSKDRPAVLVLITDAEIGNEREIVALMRQHPSLPVHCFGIDTTLNDSLLLDLVRQQGGTFLALQPTEDVAAIVTQLGRTLRQPVLVNLQLPAGWELAAGAVPNLYAGQAHLISVRGPQGLEHLQVSAEDADNAPVRLKFQLTPVSEAGPRLRWCKERLVSLVAKEDETAAIRLSKESNLLCPLTAFVAWDEAEKVAVANHRLVQPALAPKYAASFEMPTIACCDIPMRRNRASRMVIGSSDEWDTQFSLKRDAQEEEAANHLRLLERIEELMGVLTHHPDIAGRLRQIIDGLLQRGNDDQLKRLLDECDDEVRCWQRIQSDLTCQAHTLSRRLSQSASFFGSLSSKRRTPPNLNEVSKALKHIPSNGLPQMMAERLDAMRQLEGRIRQRVEDFLRQHVNPAAPAPAPQPENDPRGSGE